MRCIWCGRSECRCDDMFDVGERDGGSTASRVVWSIICTILTTLVVLVCIIVSMWAIADRADRPARPHEIPKKDWGDRK